MKRLLCMLLVLLMLCGCGQDKDEIEMAANFYYINAEITYNSPLSVIACEVRESHGYKDNLLGLLDLYFAGPLSDDFLSPYPANTITLNVYKEDTLVNIEVSKEFASLKGLDLTIACSCLTKTVTELTGCSAVRVYAADALLDGNSAITMDINDLLLLDESI